MAAQGGSGYPGKRGCVGSVAESHFTLGAFLRHKVGDTTGAGDVFHGGFLYAYLYRYMGPAMGVHFAGLCSLCERGVLLELPDAGRAHGNPDIGDDGTFPARWHGPGR